ncbi:MAG: hypothetical protein AAF961_13470, partial [Planctomycetota bacterium]
MGVTWPLEVPSAAASGDVDVVVHQNGVQIGVTQTVTPVQITTTGIYVAIVTVDISAAVEGPIKLTMIDQAGDQFPWRDYAAGGVDATAPPPTSATISGSVDVATIKNQDADAALVDPDKLLAYFQLALRGDPAILADRAAEYGEIIANQGSGPGSFVPTTDSLQGSRDG